MGFSHKIVTILLIKEYRDLNKGPSRDGTKWGIISVLNVLGGFLDLLQLDKMDLEVQRCSAEWGAKFTVQTISKILVRATFKFL